MLRNFLQRFFDFFLFSSLYIALCAVVMVYQTTHLLLAGDPPRGLVLFIFFSTICSYNFHWYLTPHSETSSQRIHWAQQHKGWHLFLYFTGLIGAAVCFFTIREHWLALAFGAFLTFLYSAPKLPQEFFKSLKQIAVGKTIFLSFVWTYVSTVLPILVTGAAWTRSALFFTLGRFFLIYAICILFDYRDRLDDQKDGIRSMITYFNERGIDILFGVSIALFVVATLLLGTTGYSWVTMVVLLVPGVLTALLYHHAKKNFSDYLYYFVLDGLMCLSGVLMFLLSFNYF
ncbi:MAG TPA: UbiA family prenyltransferase [Puia sp.]|nr:UbiA family prenyltransferase [Puia sp.]